MLGRERRGRYDGNEILDEYRRVKNVVIRKRCWNILSFLKGPTEKY